MISSLNNIYFTLDTDWCSEKILQFAVKLFQDAKLPCTIFTTGRYAALDVYDPSQLEVGLHPNFNHTTIESYEAELIKLKEIYPQAIGVASHAMMSSTVLLDLFQKHHLKYDRNLLFYKQAEAKPIRHHNGLLRLPVFWEDDIWFSVEPGARFSPALLSRERFYYIFNFHPIHLYMNTESKSHYLSFKAFQRNDEKLQAHRSQRYGARSFFFDLIDYVQKHQLATGILKDFLNS